MPKLLTYHTYQCSSRTPTQPSNRILRARPSSEVTTPISRLPLLALFYKARNCEFRRPDADSGTVYDWTVVQRTSSMRFCIAEDHQTFSQGTTRKEPKPNSLVGHPVLIQQVRFVSQLDASSTNPVHLPPRARDLVDLRRREDSSREADRLSHIGGSTSPCQPVGEPTGAIQP